MAVIDPARRSRRGDRSIDFVQPHAPACYNSGMPIHALIFDFDGLIVDTETPAFESWRSMYAQHGHELALDQWQAALGRGTGHGFDALAQLGVLVGDGFDPETVLARRMELKHAMSLEQPLLQGVEQILAEARSLGLPCAVASSSGRAWVEGWLQHHNILHEFRCVRTADDVQATKPAPDLFLSAAACLGAAPEQCLVFEDSPNGVQAARAAGMRSVAVPGAIAGLLPPPPADLVLPSLDALPLHELLARFQ